MNNALKIAYFGLNISIKLNEMLIRTFFRPHEPLEVSPYEITYGRRPRRGEKKKYVVIYIYSVARDNAQRLSSKKL